MPEPPRPTEIKLDKPARVLVVVWSDGLYCRYPWALLRAHCPSAGERTAREQADPLAILKQIPSNDLSDIRLVGNYALSLTWADGHRAGIYTWEHLRRLADEDAVETQSGSSAAIENR